MKQACRKFASFALAALLLLGTIPPVPARADEGTAAAAATTATVRASFAENTVKIDGRFTDGGWSLPGRAADGALIGAQWDTETLYLAVHTPKKEDVTVILNGTEITKNNASLKTYTVRATGKTNTEIAVPFSAIGAEVKDYGAEISAEVKIGDTVWTGSILLTSTVWFAANNPNASAGYAGTRTQAGQFVHEICVPTSNQGIVTTTGGYKFFDRYSETGPNPPSVSSTLYFQGSEFEAICDRTADTVLGFTFCANSMPVYPLGTDNDYFPYITTCGMNWYITGKSPEYEELPYVTMAIINTELGLVFVLRDADRDRTYPLNKHLGDTFYVETVWTKEGDLILSIDGEQVAFFDDAEMSRWDLGENMVRFHLLRNKESAKSEKDNFDIDITGVCVGKNYGETFLESLTLESLTQDEFGHYLAVKDITLPTTFTSHPFNTPVAIEWESSDPGVIDPQNGKVTRPETDGKLVTLTANAPSTGASVSLDVFVYGQNPQTDVLIVKNNITAYEGSGVKLDAPFFTFDETNNSIVRDLKESKTVNVIALKDSDDSCRLNESNLTIWVSDDSKTYTQVKPFKLLRDGQYTYLYDFEATGRYIKVHFTLHTKTDTTFTAPISGMIDAYYEDVFGDGGTAFESTSSFAVKNETDSDMMDVLTPVTIEETGAKCLDENYADIRFLLGDELLYHAFDGKKFLVRIPDIPAGESVTVTVLSGNEDAKDISNIEPLYEVMYGTRETSSDYHPGGAIRLKNGLRFNTQGQGLENTGFAYFFAENNGRSRTNLLPAGGTYDVLTQPMGWGYDDVTGRIFVQGVHPENGQKLFKIMYSDNNGKLWTEARINFKYEIDRTLQSYDDIIKVSAYDGEGPNVDFVLMTRRPSDEMKEYYGHQYEHSELFSLYSTDGGKTWESSTNAVRFFGGDDTIHRWEHGLCEQVCMETADGVLVAYSRLQYENILHFGYAFSYDFGKTWTEEAELSNIYTSNTQPTLFKADGNEFILWGGNNVYGGGSYRRYPMNVAISYDNLLTFTGIQDIYLRTDYQGMVNGTCINAMNPNVYMYDDGEMQVTVISDDTMGGERFRNIWVSDFTDFFFRTKGAYDSFENSTTEYEGWGTTGGQVEASDAQSTSGEKSMMFTPDSAAVRSLPEVRDGKIAFDLYIEDVTKANLTLELETSHGPDYGKASPIGFALTGDTLTFLRGDAIAGAVKNGWNHFEFDLSLASETPSATLSVNGGEAVDVPVEAEIGDYICYMHIVCKGELTYYLDSFLVNDMDNAAVPTVTALSGEGTGITDDPAVPGEDDGASPALWISIGAAVVVIGGAAAVIAMKSKKKSA